MKCNMRNLISVRNTAKRLHLLDLEALIHSHFQMTRLS